MFKIKTSSVLFLRVLLKYTFLFLCLALGWYFLNKGFSTIDRHYNLKYYQQAEAINDFYYKQNITVRQAVVRKVLIEVDKYLPKYFPEGEFTRKDLIAIAMVESRFDQYLVGQHREYGVFQILPESFEWAKIKRNQFDISVNTQVALFVLKEKYKKHKNYKQAIIAYNGLVRQENGQFSEVYWKKFRKCREELDDII